MPRQTFATRQFFVNVCESTVQERIPELPRLFSRVQFVAANEKLHCLLFLFAADDAQQPIQLNVSVLPLSDDCTKVTVHGSYTNGCAFYNDPYLANALLNVEAALQAAISGSTSFEPQLQRKKLAHRYRHVRHSTTAFITNALRARKLLRPSHT